MNEINILPPEELTHRVARVQQSIRNAQAEACIIASSVNLFYLCGFIFDGYLYIRPEGQPLLFVKRPVGITNASYIRKPEQIAELLTQQGIDLPRTISLESDTLSHSTVLRLQTALGMPEVKNVSGEMRRLRSIKSEAELNLMRECAQVHTVAYARIPQLYWEGMTDIEFQIEMERIMRRMGSIGIFRTFGDNMEIFMGSVLNGSNAEVPSPYDFAMGGSGISPFLPIGANGQSLKKGTTLMVDMAGNFRPWMSDMTRTFAIGSVPEIAHRAHQVSVDLNRWVEENAQPGTPCAHIYNHALEVVKAHQLEPYFMGTVQQAQFVGHGVGLEINEPPVLSPRSKDTLQEGMAFAFEPKFVLPEIGAVGVENTFIVTATGVEKITMAEERLIEL